MFPWAVRQCLVLQSGAGGSLPDPGQGSRIAVLPPRAQQPSLTAPSLEREAPKCSEGAGIAPSSSLSSTGESGLSLAAAGLGRKNVGIVIKSCQGLHHVGSKSTE